MVSNLIVLEKASFKEEWLRNLLRVILLWARPVSSVSLHCDWHTVIGRAKNQTYNDKCRHKCLRHNIMRHLLSNRIVSLNFVRSELNLLTKPLSWVLASSTLRGMGLLPIKQDQQWFSTYMIGDHMKWVHMSNNKS